MNIDTMIDKAFEHACGNGAPEDTRVICRIYDRANVEYRSPYMFTMHPDDFADALATAFYVGAKMYEGKKIAI